MSDQTKCIYPDCKNQRKTRGLCSNHYQMARTVVMQGRANWDQLEKAGKALSVKDGKRPGKINWFIEGLKP